MRSNGLPTLTVDVNIYVYGLSLSPLPWLRKSVQDDNVFLAGHREASFAQITQG